MFPLLRKRASEHDCAGKVKIMDKMPSERLRQYTAHADLGLTLDKDSNINYRFSLPNKLFDYISAGVPVLATPMVEVKNIVETYGVGEVTASLEPELLAEQIRNMLNDENKRHAWKSNLKKAASQLTWEQEKKKWEAVLNAAVKT